jgi:uncharacterized RDD family membrane protein YckC
MNPQIESGNERELEAQPIDPEAYEASEQRFDASLHEPARRMMERTEKVESAGRAGAPPETIVPAESPRGLVGTDCEETGGGLNEGCSQQKLQDSSAGTGVASDPDRWREELASRLNNYRARRRPKAPRYPSLQMKFEVDDPAWTNPTPNPTPNPTGEAAASAPQKLAAGNGSAGLSRSPMEDGAAPGLSRGTPERTPESTARVIPFPRSSAPAPRPIDELAEPVPSRPRILDVPDVEPPPPALGGILISREQEEANPRRAGIEVPLQSAAMSQRALAGALDAGIVGLAFAGFAYLFIRITATVPPLKLAALMGSVLAGVLWFAYQYLLLVYTGSTPGIHLAKLRLSLFDGTPPPRKVRRWRVLTSILSVLSVGLGYLWCFLDEDQLCWHDRITATHMAPRS